MGEFGFNREAFLRREILTKLDGRQTAALTKRADDQCGRVELRTHNPTLFAEVGDHDDILCSDICFFRAR